MIGMSRVVNMHEAKTTLSKLVELVESGEEVIIARAGQPVARLVAAGEPRRRNLGAWKGKVWLADDFDAPLPDEHLRRWRGE
jgi:prevent-host-death family protein